MKKKVSKFKMILSLALVCILIGGFVTNAYAYNLTGYKWSSSNIKYYYDNYNSSRGISFFGKGVTAWNNAGVDASISYSYPNGFCITEVDISGVTWDGVTAMSVSGNYITSATVSINREYTDTWEDDGALQSVVVHEIGHVLGLNEAGTNKVIMNSKTWGTNSRYGTYSLKTPQSDDKNGVNAIY